MAYPFPTDGPRWMQEKNGKGEEENCFCWAAAFFMKEGKEKKKKRK